MSLAEGSEQRSGVDKGEEACWSGKPLANRERQAPRAARWEGRFCVTRRTRSPKGRVWIGMLAPPSRGCGCRRGHLRCPLRTKRISLGLGRQQPPRPSYEACDAKRNGCVRHVRSAVSSGTLLIEGVPAQVGHGTAQCASHRTGPARPPTGVQKKVNVQEKGIACVATPFSWVRLATGRVPPLFVVVASVATCCVVASMSIGGFEESERLEGICGGHAARGLGHAKSRCVAGTRAVVVWLK